MYLLDNIHTHTDTLVGRQVVGRQVSLLLATPPSPPYPSLHKVGRLVEGLKPSSQRIGFFLLALSYSISNSYIQYCLLTTFTLIVIVNCVKCAQRKILCDTTTRARKR